MRNESSITDFYLNLHKVYCNISKLPACNNLSLTEQLVIRCNNQAQTLVSESSWRQISVEYNDYFRKVDDVSPFTQVLLYYSSRDLPENYNRGYSDMLFNGKQIPYYYYYAIRRLPCAYCGDSIEAILETALDRIHNKYIDSQATRHFSQGLRPHQHSPV
ncbi:hypothetical protein AKO1_000982 [Acrasis kona]|uniref:Uncharacterized protein n=1 Tax=Acrasis kona TaxID=1008807 RepID=A0AAW2ZCK5_9EUKA